MKKCELMELYGGIKASDKFKEDIFLYCTGRKIKITQKKNRNNSFIAAAAVIAIIICGTAAFVFTDKDISEKGHIAETTASDVEAVKPDDDLYEEQEENAAAQNTSEQENNGEADISDALSEPEFIWPCPTVWNITDGYSPDSTQTFHNGIDIAAPDCGGEPIVASASGTILTASDIGNGYGIHVVIDHGDGLTTLYGQMSSCCVQVGDEVQQGQTIGYIGSTGYAYGVLCHFEVRVNDKPVEPLEYVDIPEK